MRINSVSAYNSRLTPYRNIIQKAPERSFQTAFQTTQPKVEAPLQNISFGWIKTNDLTERALLWLKNPREPDNFRANFGERHLNQYEEIKNTPILEFGADIEKGIKTKYGDPFLMDVMFRPVYLRHATDEQIKYQDKVIKKMYKKFGIVPGPNKFLAEYDKLVELGQFLDKHVPLDYPSMVYDLEFQHNPENYITVRTKKKKGGLFNRNEMVWKKEHIIKPYFPKILAYKDGRIGLDKTHAYDLPEGYELVGEGLLPLK